MKKQQYNRESSLLDTGICRIETFGDHFVAYNTRFLGVSQTGDFIMNGSSTVNSKFTKEFCFGYGIYHQLYILDVYEMPNGKKYAATEMLMGMYGFWEILD